MTAGPIDDRPVPPWLVTYARAEFDRLELGFLLPDEPPFGATDWAHVEHLMHEMAHALLLNLPLKKGLSASIAGAIGSLPRAAQTENEALTLAVEWVAAQLLGLPMTCDDVYECAFAQGCSKGEVDRALRDPKTVLFAQTLAFTLGELDPR